MKTRIFLSVLGMAAVIVEADVDSLHSLQSILQIEMKPENRILILKDKRVTDSLMRLQGEIRPSGFEGLISDSAMAHEVKTQDEFRRYWGKLEKQGGITALKKQYASVDIDKSVVPKAYLFDSSVVVYPGVIILRKKFATMRKR